MGHLSRVVIVSNQSTMEPNGYLNRHAIEQALEIVLFLDLDQILRVHLDASQNSKAALGKFFDVLVAIGEMGENIFIVTNKLPSGEPSHWAGRPNLHFVDTEMIYMSPDPLLQCAHTWPVSLPPDWPKIESEVAQLTGEWDRTGDVLQIRLDWGHQWANLLAANIEKLTEGRALVVQSDPNAITISTSRKLCAIAEALTKLKPKMQKACLVYMADAGGDPLALAWTRRQNGVALGIVDHPDELIHSVRFYLRGLNGCVDFLQRLHRDLDHFKRNQMQADTTDSIMHCAFCLQTKLQPWLFRLIGSCNR